MPKWLVRLWYRWLVYSTTKRPANFSYVEKGDVLVRVMPGFKPDSLWYDKAVVESVSETQIVCRVVVDVHRTMKFDRITGRMTGLSEEEDPQWLEFPIIGDALKAIQ